MPSDIYPLVTFIGTVELSIAPPELPPFAFDAIVEEQDTCLLFSPNPEIREPCEDYKTLVFRMITQQPRLPGEVIVRKTCPARFLAVVHDLEQAPACKEEWVAHALDHIFSEAGSHRITTLAMPVLGTCYGTLQYETFITLLLSTLSGKSSIYPEKIWLIVPAPVCNRIMELLVHH